jgi:hypothetical protein
MSEGRVMNGKPELAADWFAPRLFRALEVEHSRVSCPVQTASKLKKAASRPVKHTCVDPDASTPSPAETGEEMPEETWTARGGPGRGVDAHVVHQYKNSEGNRCTAFVAVCSSTTEDNLANAEFIAKSFNDRHVASLSRPSCPVDAVAQGAKVSPNDAVEVDALLFALEAASKVQFTVGMSPKEVRSWYIEGSQSAFVEGHKRAQAAAAGPRELPRVRELIAASEMYVGSHIRDLGVAALAELQEAGIP